MNDITIRYLDYGNGPLVLFLHGFPDLARSWIYQLQAVADAGFRAVAPDLRGSGGSDAPASATQYTHFHIVGDLVALMDELGHQRAAVIGHDMGAGVAWNMALMLPRRISAVAGLSVPLRRRPSEPPLTVAKRQFGMRFYQIQFQQAKIPEAHLDQRVETFLPGIFAALSANDDRTVTSMIIPEGRQFADLFPTPVSLPAWLDPGELGAYVETFRKSGFRGSINWYRNIDRNWELMAPWASARVTAPAMYIAGDQDIAYRSSKASGSLQDLPDIVPRLVDSVVLSGCGHWLSKEQPRLVTDALLRLLSECD